MELPFIKNRRCVRVARSADCDYFKPSPIDRFVYVKSTFFALVHIKMSRIVLILFVLQCFCLLSVGLNYTGWINLGNFCYLWVAYRIIERVTNGKSRVIGIKIGKELRHILIFFKTKSCCRWQKHLPKRIPTTIPTPTPPGSVNEPCLR